MITVTCVTPTTKKREHFLRVSVDYFYAQRLRPAVTLKWVILGEHDQAPIVGERIRFHTPEQAKPMTLGQKRNMLNELVGPTDYILHWDDDDWYSPDRVQHQLDFHLSQGAAVSGYHSLLYVHIGQVFRYHDPGMRPWCAGTSLMYWPEYWNQNRFSNRQVAEDFFFCLKAKNDRELASQAGEQHVIARTHDDSTCHPKFGSRCFPMVKRSELNRIQREAVCGL